MEKERQIKLLSIIALVVAVAGMTLGFAAFSTTLNISSSATVTPSSEDFKIKIYGFEDSMSLLNTLDGNGYDLESLSDTWGCSVDAYSARGENAIIDNVSHTISNLNVNIYNDMEESFYLFVLNNEGKYDAYLDLSDFNINGTTNLNKYKTGECTPNGDTTPELVERACKNLSLTYSILNDTGDLIRTTNNYLKISPESSVLLKINIYQSGEMADGPYNVQFENIQLKFSTTQ